MGYTPGLPPSFYTTNTPEIRRLSSIFEAAGLNSQYPHHPACDEYDEYTIFVWNPPDGDPEEIADFIKENLVQKGRFSNPDIKPIVHSIPFAKCFSIVLPTSADVQAATELCFEISFHGSPLDIRASRLPTQKPMPPINLATKHPRRVIVTNVDPNEIASFPQFLQQYFAIDGYFVPESMPDCVLFDVLPPISPEGAALQINRLKFGRFLIQARSYRSVTLQSNTNEDDYGDFSVLNDNIDLQQILQPQTNITHLSGHLISTGRSLRLLNIVPISSISDAQESQIIIHDLFNECRKYGNATKCKLSSSPALGACLNYGVAIIEFEKPESASDAQLNLAGRRYNGRVVITMLCE